MPSKVWDDITYPFPSLNGYTVEVWKWISNYITHFILDVITYPWMYLMGRYPNGALRVIKKHCTRLYHMYTHIIYSFTFCRVLLWCRCIYHVYTLYCFTFYRVRLWWRCIFLFLIVLLTITSRPKNPTTTKNDVSEWLTARIAITWRVSILRIAHYPSKAWFLENLNLHLLYIAFLHTVWNGTVSWWRHEMETFSA